MLSKKEELECQEKTVRHEDYIQLASVQILLMKLRMKTGLSVSAKSLEAVLTDYLDLGNPGRVAAVNFGRKSDILVQVIQQDHNGAGAHTHGVALPAESESADIS